jgi:hypothetical protein
MVGMNTLGTNPLGEELGIALGTELDALRGRGQVAAGARPKTDAGRGLL